METTATETAVNPRPSHARIFHDFMVREVWVMDSRPAPGGGVILTGCDEDLYAEWADAHAAARRLGAVALGEVDDRDIETSTLFRFPDGSELVIANNGGGMRPPDDGEPRGEPIRRVLLLTREAHDTIRGMAEYEFQDSSLAIPEGGNLVPALAETVARIDGLRFEGESYSDVIIRIAAFSRSGGKLN